MSFSVRALQSGAILLFAAAAAAVAGCSSSSTPTPAPTATPTTNPSGAVIFTFTNAGGTATIAAGASGSTSLSAGTVGGVTTATTWGANNPVTVGTTTIAMTANQALNNGDIVSNSIAFPAFSVATAVDSNGVALTGSWTIVDYLKVTATPETIFTQTPGITVTIGAPATITGKTSCSYFSLGGSTTSPQWKQVLNGTLSGSTITFAAATLPPPNTVDVGNGSTNVPYLALACK